MSIKRLPVTLTFRLINNQKVIDFFGLDISSKIAQKGKSRSRWLEQQKLLPTQKVVQKLEEMIKTHQN